jgi:hypothetical protein
VDDTNRFPEGNHKILANRSGSLRVDTVAGGNIYNTSVNVAAESTPNNPKLKLGLYLGNGTRDQIQHVVRSESDAGFMTPRLRSLVRSSHSDQVMSEDLKRRLTDYAEKN